MKDEINKSEKIAHLKSSQSQHDHRSCEGTEAEVRSCGVLDLVLNGISSFYKIINIIILYIILPLSLSETAVACSLALSKAYFIT
jgi:hypothetical protein